VRAFLMDRLPYIDQHHHPSPGPHPALKRPEPNERLHGSRHTSRLAGPCVCGRVRGRGVPMDRHPSIVTDITCNLPRPIESRSIDSRDRSSDRVELSTLARAPCAASIDCVHRLPPSRISTPAGKCPDPSARPSSLHVETSQRTYRVCVRVTAPAPPWMYRRTSYTLHSRGCQRVCYLVPNAAEDGSFTLQTLQDPILLLSWVCFQGGGFPNHEGEIA
jgi:hypothetical protein